MSAAAYRQGVLFGHREPAAALLADVLCDECAVHGEDRDLVVTVAGLGAPDTPDTPPVSRPGRLLEVVETYRSLTRSAAGNPEGLAGALRLMRTMSYLDQEVVEALIALTDPEVRAHL